MTTDAVFFAEWEARAPGDRRSLDRARHLLALLGVERAPAPVLTVVGSKGKGTAATYASAWLAAAGRTVVTVTSPALRGNAERVRVNGARIPDGELARLAGLLGRALSEMPGVETIPGYLSPSGLFTVAGILHAARVRADAIVLEAGMGGGGDEVSLFPPAVAGLTEIFAEHVGVLGDTTVDIAREKSSVVSAGTRAVLTLPQTPDVLDAVRRTVAARAGIDVEVMDAGVVDADVVNPVVVDAGVDVGRAGIPNGLLRNGLPPNGLLPSGLPLDGLLPPAYGRRNALLGCAAARRLLEILGAAPPDGERLARVLGSVTLPGRLSTHPVPGHETTTVLVDSAINREGVATALAVARARHRAVDHVLLCLPDHKDLPGAVAELAGLPVTFVRLALGHLSFSTPLPAHWNVVGEDELTPGLLAGLGRELVALGTVYFTGKLLDVLDAPTDRLFIPDA
ncbi:hypothetical protein Misp01_82820 [Microtetraspora sp. NBRC 13810]|uniref:hypothetical protein n=1 Tax=Microtetraspora sp. NBRC 13810 TaxID=3030990 RepID=UPI0024A568B3|nr:hypothetical protein [Microtetraspora sp. NBRC 13810]GLW13154.1 hypothetical protein Misp01_82820 [Microtetraspora sp. NBRC 13810]